MARWNYIKFSGIRPFHPNRCEFICTSNSFY